MGCQASAQVEQIKYKFSSRLLLSAKETANNPQTCTQSSSKISINSSNHQLDQSIAYYQKFLQTNLNLKYPFDGLGNIQDQIGYFQNNIENWYQKGRQNGTIHGNPFDSLSLCYSMKQDVSDGRKWYEQMVVKHPQCFQLHYGLGNIYYKLQLFELAQTCYRKSIDLNPRLDKAYQNIANIYCFKKFDNSHAQEWSKFATKINPNNQYAGLVYALVNQNANIKINLLQKLSVKNSKYARIYNALGHVYVQKKQYEKAIKIFQQGFLINSQYYSIPCGLAFCYNKLNKIDESIQWSRKAVNLNPNHHEPYHCLGDAYQRKGLLKQAKLQYLKCIEINPLFGEVHFKLGNILNDLGQKQQAIKYYELYLQRDEDSIAVMQKLVKLYSKKQLINKKVEYILRILNLQNYHEQSMCILATIFKNYPDQLNKTIITEYISFCEDKQKGKKKMQEIYKKNGKNQSLLNEL